MTILEQAYELAAAFAPTETEAEQQRLMAFCKAAEAELLASLRPGVTEEDCADAFSCACAWLALSYLCAGRSFDAERFTVGDVSVQHADGKVSSDCLRTQARLLLAPWSSGGFGFEGVRT